MPKAADVTPQPAALQPVANPNRLNRSGITAALADLAKHLLRSKRWPGADPGDCSRRPTPPWRVPTHRDRRRHHRLQSGV